MAKDIIPGKAMDEVSSEALLDLGHSSKELPIIYEVVISPDGFEPDTGSPTVDTAKSTVLRYAVDKAGGVSWAAGGNVAIHVAKKLRLVAQDSIDIVTRKSFSLSVKETARIDGGKLLEIGAKVVKINGGSKPVATVGSLVEITIVEPLGGISIDPVPLRTGIPILIGPTGKPTLTPGVPIQPKLQGVITTGNPTILG
jgi:hypothetical protein